MLPKPRRHGKNKIARDRFEPRDCDCSQFPYVHEVNCMRTWERHLARKAQDLLTNNQEPRIITSDNISTDPYNPEDGPPRRTTCDVSNAIDHNRAEDQTSGDVEMIDSWEADPLQLELEDEEDTDVRSNPDHLGNPRETGAGFNAEDLDRFRGDPDVISESDYDSDAILQSFAQLGLIDLTQELHEDEDVYGMEDYDQIFGSDVEDQDDEGELFSNRFPIEAPLHNPEIPPDMREVPPAGEYDGFDYRHAKGELDLLPPLPLCIMLSLIYLHSAAYK